jgi:hypothetical protein
MTVLPLSTTTGASACSFLDLQNQALADDFAPSKHRDNAKRFLNEAQRRVFRRVRVPSGEQETTFDTVAGTASYDLDAAVVRTNSIRLVGDRVDLDERAIDQIDTSVASTGKPAAYAHVAGTVVLYPTPDGVYTLTVRFQAGAATMDDDADAPSIGCDYADLLVAYARSRLFRLEDDFEMAQAWMTDFERELNLYASDVQRPDRSGTRQVPGMFAGRPAAPRFQTP